MKSINSFLETKQTAQPQDEVTALVYKATEEYYSETGKKQKANVYYITFEGDEKRFVNFLVAAGWNEADAKELLKKTLYQSDLQGQEIALHPYYGKSLYLCPASLNTTDGADNPNFISVKQVDTIAPAEYSKKMEKYAKMNEF